MTTPLVKMIANAVKSGLAQAKAVEPTTLLRPVAGSRTPGSLVGGTNPTDTSYPCSGFESSQKHDKIGETVVDQTHIVICLVGLGVVPTSNDRVTLGGVTYPVVDLEGNPALWTLLCRK